MPFAENGRHQTGLAGLYRDDHFQARIAYDYRTARTIGDFGNIPINQAPADYVDVNLTCSLNEQFSIYLNGSNVLGEIERNYFRFSSDHRQYHSQAEFEPRYSAGVRARF